MQPVILLLILTDILFIGVLIGSHAYVKPWGLAKAGSSLKDMSFDAQKELGSD